MAESVRPESGEKMAAKKRSAKKKSAKQPKQIEGLVRPGEKGYPTKLAEMFGRL